MKPDRPSDGKREVVSKSDSGYRPEPWAENAQRKKNSRKTSTDASLPAVSPIGTTGQLRKLSHSTCRNGGCSFHANSSTTQSSRCSAKSTSGGHSSRKTFFCCQIRELNLRSGSAGRNS